GSVYRSLRGAGAVRRRAGVGWRAGRSVLSSLRRAGAVAVAAAAVTAATAAAVVAVEADMVESNVAAVGLSMVWDMERDGLGATTLGVLDSGTRARAGLRVL